MRKIKFRAWDKDDKVMVSPDYIDREGWGWWKSNSIPTRSNILMQYTGLCDKNGREIYEGDIYVVRVLHDGDEYIWNQAKSDGGGEGAIPQEIIWSDAGCCFIFGMSSRIIDASHDFEIIGNIHENPELLEDNQRRRGGS